MVGIDLCLTKGKRSKDWLDRSVKAFCRCFNLRNSAIETQSSILEYLEEAKQNNEVTSFQSFYIVNSIAVTGSKKIMGELSTYSEVTKIQILILIHRTII